MALAPLLGGVLNQQFGFRANFYAIAICVFASLFCTFFLLDETLPAGKRTKFKIEQIIANFFRVLTNPKFLQLTLVISLLFAGFLLFLSNSAIIFVIEFGIDKSMYPYYQFSLLLAYLTASLVSGYLIKNYSIKFVKKLGMCCLLLSNFSFFIVTYTCPENAILLTLSMVPYSFGFIWLQTPYVAEIMGLMPDIKGIAASILTSLRLLITTGVVASGARMYNGTIIPTFIWIFIINFLILLIAYRYERKS
jgi:DHA1 family bicyclomycin/chloramphenicol resistance-like MFS transporter